MTIKFLLIPVAAVIFSMPDPVVDEPEVLDFHVMEEGVEFIEVPVRELRVNITTRSFHDEEPLDDLARYLEELRGIEQQLNELETKKRELLERMIERCAALGEDTDTYAPPLPPH